MFLSISQLIIDSDMYIFRIVVNFRKISINFFHRYAVILRIIFHRSGSVSLHLSFLYYLLHTFGSRHHRTVSYHSMALSFVLQYEVSQTLGKQDYFIRMLSNSLTVQGNGVANLHRYIPLNMTKMLNNGNPKMSCLNPWNTQILLYKQKGFGEYDLGS